MPFFLASRLTMNGDCTVVGEAIPTIKAGSMVGNVLAIFHTPAYRASLPVRSLYSRVTGTIAREYR